MRHQRCLVCRSILNLKQETKTSKDPIKWFDKRASFDWPVHMRMCVLIERNLFRNPNLEKIKKKKMIIKNCDSFFLGTGCTAPFEFIATDSTWKKNKTKEQPYVIIFSPPFVFLPPSFKDPVMFHHPSTFRFRPDHNIIRNQYIGEPFNIPLLYLNLFFVFSSERGGFFVNIFLDKLTPLKLLSIIIKNVKNSYFYRPTTRPNFFAS